MFLQLFLYICTMKKSLVSRKVEKEQSNPPHNDFARVSVFYHLLCGNLFSHICALNLISFLQIFLHKINILKIDL